MSASPKPAAPGRERTALLSVEDVYGILLARARPLNGAQTLPLSEALGHVLASEVRAGVDVPGFDNSAMDGYAVRSVDVAGDGEVRLRVSQRVAAGRMGTDLGPAEAARIFTGAPMPTGADAVVMQEDCLVEGGHVLVRGPVRPGAWVRPRGNNIGAGQMVLPAGTLLRAQELGMAAAVGCARVNVRRRPRVSVLASGDELVAPGEALAPGCIYNSNSTTLVALAAASGFEVRDLGVVPDERGATRRALTEAAADSDLVLSSGGVSVGEADHMKAALESVGELSLWKVAVKPGKPLTYGRIGEADYLGLPGNPVSVLATFCLFVRPFMARRLGVLRPAAPWLSVPAAFEWPQAGTRREYLRARLVASADGITVAELFPRQGSDVLSGAVWADGLVEVREGRTLVQGEPVPFASFNDLLGGAAA